MQWWCAAGIFAWTYADRLKTGMIDAGLETSVRRSQVTNFWLQQAALTQIQKQCGKSFGLRQVGGVSALNVAHHLDAGPLNHHGLQWG